MTKSLHAQLRQAVEELQAAYISLGRPKVLRKALDSVECAECYLAGWIAGEPDMTIADPAVGEEELGDDNE